MQAVRIRSPVSYRLGDETEDRVLAPHFIFQAKSGHLSVAGRQIRNPLASREVGEWLELPGNETEKRYSSGRHVPHRGQFPTLQPGLHRAHRVSRPSE